MGERPTPVERVLASPVRYVLSVMLAAVMLLSVIWYADFELLLEKLRHARAPSLLLLVLSYLATVWYRASRFRLLLEPGARTRDWFRLTALHNFFFTFVPFKLGEASFLPLAKKRSVPMAESASALLLCRVFEFATLSCMGLAGALTLGMAASFLPVLVLLAAIIGFSLQFDRLANRAARLCRSLHRRFRWRSAERLAAAFDTSQDWFASHKEDRWRLLGLTILVCALASFSVYLSFRALGVDLTVGAVMFLYAGLAFLGAAGVSTVAGIGVSELGLAGLLVLLGFPLAQATTLALLARFFLLASSLAGTGVAVLAVRTSGAGHKGWGS